MFLTDNQVFLQNVKKLVAMKGSKGEITMFSNSENILAQSLSLVFSWALSIVFSIQIYKALQLKPGKRTKKMLCAFLVSFAVVPLVITLTGFLPLSRVIVKVNAIDFFVPLLWRIKSHI